MRRITLLLTLLGAFALAATAATARAGLITSLIGGNCGSTSYVFAPWSDASDYYFPQNGGFENGSAGWGLSGPAQVVDGNDPFNLSGAGSSSLQIGAGGSASISTCYGVAYPAIRFVATGVGGPATIHVRVIAHSLLGVLTVLDGGTFTVGDSWQPSPKLSTLAAALAAPVGTKSMSLQISVDSGTAQIDDLYVDPFVVAL
jgi:hypothetical protein